MARSLFLRGLAVVYFIAFISFLPQINGLIGSNGILPIQKYLDGVHSEYGARAYLYLPTVAWLNSSDLFLHLLTWAGIVLSIALLVGILPLATVIALYVLYLSIDTAGQTFFSFQWDSLLLEAGFAAILLAPPGFRPSYTDPPPRMAIWLFRFLIFRLMLESGVVKLLSGDPTWRNLTALNYHYETQPLPTPPAWYFAHLPGFMQKVSVASVFGVELAVPFLFLATRRLRRIAAVLTIGFQLLIAFTGNYTFFNMRGERNIDRVRLAAAGKHAGVDSNSRAIGDRRFWCRNISSRQSVRLVCRHDDVSVRNRDRREQRWRELAAI